jgi:hypothetical protein
VSSYLLCHVTTNAIKTDVLICQDLMSLPQGERQNACWFPGELETCLRQLSFGRTNCIVQRTARGNRWFNSIAGDYQSGNALLAMDKVYSLVRDARQRQWTAWSQLEKTLPVEGTAERALIDAIDLDLQLAALTRQLRDAGAFEVRLDPDVTSRIRSTEVVRRV